MGPARIWLMCALLGCGGRSASPDHRPTVPVAAEPPVQLVTSMVIIDACPDSRRLDSKQANREIEELVGPCKKVPGGAAHFSATLQPNGSVELASPEGDPEEGIVPTCVLQQAKQLRHRLRLTKACKFDVKLEQRVAGPQ